MKEILITIVASLLGFIFGWRKQNIDLCSDRLDELEKSIIVYNKIIDDMAKKIESLTKEIHKLESRIEDLMSENKKLKKQL